MATALTANWFYAIGGQKLSGPFLQVKNLYANRAISNDTLVWREGMPAWTKLSAVPDLFALLTIAPVPTLAMRPVLTPLAAAPIVTPTPVSAAPLMTATAAPVTAAPVPATSLTVPSSSPPPARSPTASPPPAASPKAGSAATGGWLYVELSTGQQKQTSIDKLKALITSGSLDPATFGWKEGMIEWVALSSVPEFKPLFAQRAGAAGGAAGGATAAEWFYSDKRGQRQGPITIQQLSDLYGKFEVNDITLVWKAGLQKWERLMEVSELKDIPSAAQKAGTNLLTHSLVPRTVYLDELTGLGWGSVLSTALQRRRKARRLQLPLARELLLVVVVRRDGANRVLQQPTHRHHPLAPGLLWRPVPAVRAARQLQQVVVMCR